MSLALLLPSDWRAVLRTELDAPHFSRLEAFLEEERRQHTVYPPVGDVFAAFRMTSFRTTRVVIVGQDPYHGPGQAHGLCFSVPRSVKPPPSLRNMMKELAADVGCAMPVGGCLAGWARQGCLLLNTVLTVRESAANSHRGRGWEYLTDAVIRALNASDLHVVFALWGRHAQQKAELVETSRHSVVLCAHPSPFSARRGFLGTRPFSRINDALTVAGQPPIDWSLAGDASCGAEERGPVRDWCSSVGSVWAASVTRD